VVLESNFLVMLFEYVRIGIGVALSPLPSDLLLPSESRLPGITLRNAAYLFGEEPLYYIRRKGEFETPHATRFREMVTSNSVGQAVTVASRPPSSSE
jgi:hypothetical protein